MSEYIHEHLTGEKPGGHRNQIILMVIFFIVWIIDSFALRLTTFLWSFTYFWIFIGFGGLLIIAAIYFINASHKELFDMKVDELATTGVFARVRHPMYLGSHLIYLGLAISTFSLASIVLWVAIFAFYDSLANYEENKLEERFGEEFLEYRNSVRKWIPT
ncbi:MAG: methyltransferase family protein [Candidatus Thorarchaeota archaeon]